ncbi:MAG: TatD family hydrolase [Nostocoides sp.]|uniref:TatD family hydrolase n=1 Tax=Nostocoides sp. TaxID=1917966 RepID=UPI003C71D723
MPHDSTRQVLPPHPDPLPMPLVDNHAHLDLVRDDVPTLGVAAAVAAAGAVGVDRIVQIGCDLASAEISVRLAHQHPELVAGVALHPNEAPRLAAQGALAAAYARIAELAADPRVRVVGESGLDYFRTGPQGREVQHESFRWHIELAKRLDKPLQIHDRDSHEQVLAVLDDCGAPRRVVLHCFSGDVNFARECLERGFYLSFAGPITFKNNHGLRDALAVTPLDRLLLETDAPYLTPHPWRGAGNSPYLLATTARTAAAVLGVAVAHLCEAVSATSEDLYGPW